jgi:hypothetical protein
VSEDRRSLREAWDLAAADWLRFRGEPDIFAWRFNIPAFLDPDERVVCRPLHDAARG